MKILPDFYVKLITDPVKYIKKSIFYIKTRSAVDFIRKVREKLLLELNNEKLYKEWIKRNEPDERELEKQRHRKFDYNPEISIITPVYNPDRDFLVAMIESVLAQTYPVWELCIADGSDIKLKEILEGYEKKDKRIKVKFLPENRGIAGNSNEALAMAEGDFIALLDHDDLLPPFSLFEVVHILQHNRDADFIYSDEDKIAGTRRLDHYFKPDWSPDTLRSYNYTGHFAIYRKALLLSQGGFREGFDGSQDYDLNLRISEAAKHIIHIPKILYHWRIHKDSTAGDLTVKPQAVHSARKALEEHLKRIDLEGTVEEGLFLTSYKVTYNIKNSPKISVIIPSFDHSEDLSRCINSIIEKSDYKNMEIIIAENNSREEKTFLLYEELKKIEYIKIISWNRPFNYSAVNNFAAKEASGDLLLFLNNDTEVINSDCFTRLAEHAMRKDIGAAGGKLYFPDGTIQHGGVITGIGDVAGHSHKGLSGDFAGYGGRLKVIQNVSAVTAACLMMRHDVFNEVRGFDEDYILSFGDVDLCLKLREKGYLIVWTPYAELYHYESKTRGYEDTPEKEKRFFREVELFHKKWKNFMEKGDPYYNRNLTPDRENFSLRT